MNIEVNFNYIKGDQFNYSWLISTKDTYYFGPMPYIWNHLCSAKLS